MKYICIVLYRCVVYQYVVAVVWLLCGFLDWIVGNFPFDYWYGITIDIMCYVDVIYGDGAVSDHIFGYVRFESDHTWSPHILFEFLALSTTSISRRVYMCLLFNTLFNKL